MFLSLPDASTSTDWLVAYLKLTDGIHCQTLCAACTALSLSLRFSAVPELCHSSRAAFALLLCHLLHPARPGCIIPCLQCFRSARWSIHISMGGLSGIAEWLQVRKLTKYYLRVMDPSWLQSSVS
jgi:hypothetical protein